MVIGLGVGIGLLQFARQRVALTFGDAGREVEIGANQARVAPFLVDAEHTRQGTLAELRVGHITVTRGLVGVGELVAISDVPCQALLVAAVVERVVNEAAVGVVFGVHVQAHLAQRHHGVGVELENSRQGV